jgi:hypothetical protein
MTDQTPGDPRRRRLLIGSGVGAVVAVGVALALTLGGDEPTSPVEASPSPSASAAAPSPSPSPSPTPTATEPGPDAGLVPGPDAAPEGVIPADPGAPVTPTPTDRPDGRPEATVPLEQPVELRSGLTARISQVEAVEAVANLPGEIGGPALRVTVELRNDTASPVDLASAVVNAYVGPDAVPATSALEPGSQPFPAVVQPGEVATTRAVFTIPEADRGDVRFELDLSLEDVIVLFAGNAAGA